MLSTRHQNQTKMKENAAKKCNQLHQQAMEFADKAFLNEKATKHAQAKKQYEQAFQLEKQAAMLLVADYSIEPSRSVLFRSAAFLAIKAKQYREAERMAAFGLTGNPPSEIAQELRKAFQQSQQHLQLVA